MNRAARSILGFGIGLGAMYYVDPDSGHRRRRLFIDQIVHQGHRFLRFLAVALEDLGNRSKGFIVRSQERIFHPPIEDDILVERIKAALGRSVGHPGSLEVQAHQGEVTLRGPVLARDVDHLLKKVYAVRGVHALRNELEVHEKPEGISALQSKSSEMDERPELLQENWLPGTRLLAGIAGVLLIANAFRRRDVVGQLSAAGGMLALTRAISNVRFRQLLRPRPFAQAIR